MRLKNLKNLQLSTNNLTSVPSEISSITTLETLLLNNNKLKNLPESITTIESFKRNFSVKSNHLFEETLSTTIILGEK